MNLQECDRLKATIPNFEAQYVEEIPLHDIIFDEWNSQIRKHGHFTKNVPAMAQNWLASPADLPFPSVRKLPNGKRELKDGATRVLGALKAGLETIPVSHYHDVTQNFSADEWYDWQCKQNDHPLHAANTKADVQVQIQFRLDSGLFERHLGFKYHTDPSEFVTQSVAHLKSVYKNSGLSKKVLTNMLKKALGGEISICYEAHTKATAIRKIDAICDFGWETPGSPTILDIGKVYNDIAVYPCGSVEQIKQNAFANGAYKKIDNSKIKVAVVFYIGDISGKDDTMVNKVRRKAFKEYTKINNAYNCFTLFRVLPQIKTGSAKEALNQFVEMKEE